MASWAQGRRLTYGGIVIVAVLALIAVPAWKIFYKAPTCFDGVKNGNEQGVDCGGSCTKLCPSAFLSPVEDWTSFEETAPGLYNVAAYIVNPNAGVGASNVPYHMQVYDDKGALITEYNSTVTLPPNRNTLAFEGSVNMGNKVPVEGVFQFTGTPDWFLQNDSVAGVEVINKSYVDNATGSSLIVTLKNIGVKPIGRMSVYAVLYDKNSNAVGFSKTIIDSIAAGGSVQAPFTWPVSRNGAVVSIEVLLVVE